MKITIELLSIMRDFLPPDANGDAFERELADGGTVNDLLGSLNIPEDKALILLLNSTHTERDQALKDGDTLAVAPMIAGG